MRLKDLKKLLCETELELSSPVNEISYRCCNDFFLEDKIFIVVFELQSAIQRVIAHETEEFDDKRRWFVNAI